MTITQSEHVPGKLDDRHLHAQAYAKERQLHLTRRANGLDHAFDAAHTESTGDEESMVHREQLTGARRRGERIA